MAANFIPFSKFDDSIPLDTWKQKVPTATAMNELSFLRLFGFCNDPLRSVWYLRTLGVAFSIFIAAMLMTGGDLGAELVAFSAIPYALLGGGPMLFLWSLLDCEGLWRYLSVNVNDDIAKEYAVGFTQALYSDASTLKFQGFLYSAIFILLKVVLVCVQEITLLSLIQLVVWSYFVTSYFMSSGVILMALKNCRIVLLDFIDLMRGEGESIAEIIERFGEAKQSFDRFSFRTSLYLKSQIRIIPFTISATCIVFSRHGAHWTYDFLLVSIMQVSMFWRLINAMKTLNPESKAIEDVAKQLYCEAKARANIKTLKVKKLKLIAYCVGNNTPIISIHGRVVDEAMTSAVFATHLAYISAVAGPLIAAFLVPQPR